MGEGVVAVAMTDVKNKNMKVLVTTTTTKLSTNMKNSQVLRQKKKVNDNWRDEVGVVVASVNLVKCTRAQCW